MRPARPPIVFFGKGSVPRSAASDRERRLRIIAEHLDARLVAASGADETQTPGIRVIRIPAFRPHALSSACFYVGGALLSIYHSFRAGGLLAPCPIVCQSPYEGFAARAL